MCDYYKYIYYACGGQHSTYIFLRYCKDNAYIRKKCIEKRNICQTFRLPEFCSDCTPFRHGHQFAQGIRGVGGAAVVAGTGGVGVPGDVGEYTHECVAL